MRIAFLFVIAMAAGGCAALPGMLIGRAPQPGTPPVSTVVVAVNDPLARPARRVRPRIFVDHPEGRPFRLWVLLAPSDLPCLTPDDPFWPTGHPVRCSLVVSILPVD